MLQMNLRRVCKSRDIERPEQYLRGHGITLATARRAMKGGYENFSMLTVERLCLIFHCTPNDLLEWTPAPSGNFPENEPLHKLRRQEKVGGIAKLISDVPLDKLEQMEAIIRKEMGL